MSHHPERTARNVRPVNHPPSLIFAGMGFCQLLQRKNLFKVDADIIILGVYYVIVIGCYLLFEAIPVNYRPILSRYA